MSAALRTARSHGTTTKVDGATSWSAWSAWWRAVRVAGACALVCVTVACGRPAELADDEPAITRATALDPDPPLYVLVTSDGVTTIAGEPLLEDRLILARAASYHARFPRGRAVVRCAAATVHGRAVRVLDLLHEAEVDVVSVLLLK